MKLFINFLVNQIQKKKIKWLLIRFNINFRFSSKRTNLDLLRKLHFNLGCLKHFQEIQLVFRTKLNKQRAQL